MVVVKRKLVIYKGTCKAHHSTSLEGAVRDKTRRSGPRRWMGASVCPDSDRCALEEGRRLTIQSSRLFRGMARAQLQPSYADRQIRERGCRLRIETVCLLTRGSKTSFASALSLGSSTRGT